MCEITIDNFDVKFQEITYNLQKANFIAIDTEFTGLHLDNAQPSIKDDSEQRYKKLKKTVQLFNLIQIGISAFRYCNEQKVFVCDSYNVYLFPRSYGIQADSVSSLQSSCVDFLCKNNFDFNKLCYKGIPFMNGAQEKQLETRLKQHMSFAGVYRDVDERQLTRVSSEVAEWIVKASEGDHFEVNTIRDIPDFVIHKELRDRFEQCWTHQDGAIVIVEKVNKEKRLELENSDPYIQKTIDMLLGFTKIFRLLVEYKKPLIVHNGFMDLLFIYEKLHEPLPETFSEFKKKLNRLFPLVYDTKHISTECRRHNKHMKDLYDNTVLEILYKTLKQELPKKCNLFLPSIKHSPNSSLYSVKACAHEAGYDAFMTGCIFLQLAHALVTFDSKNAYNIKPTNMNDYFQGMKPYANKVQLVKAALHYVNLSGPDPECSNTKVLFVESRHDIVIAELSKALSSFGQAEIKLYSKKTAFVAVDSQCKEDMIIESFQHNKKFKVSSYSFWKHNPSAKTIIGASALVASGVLLFLLNKIIR